MKRVAGIFCASLVLLFGAIILSSCSSGSSNSKLSDDNRLTAIRNDEISTVNNGTENTINKTIGDIGTKKLIKEVHISIETKEYDEFISNLEKEVKNFGGYIQKSEINGNNYDNHRYADIVVRIPADNLDSFSTKVSSLGKIQSKTENVQNVSMDYVDIESRVNALKTQQESLLELMKKADNLNDILAIQKELTEVQYQLESCQSKLRTYDNLIAYSTVTLEIYEVDRENSNLGMWEEIGLNLSRNFTQIGSAARSIFVWFVSSSPYLLILAAIALVILLIVRFAMKASAKKGLKKAGRTPNTPEN